MRNIKFYSLFLIIILIFFLFSGTVIIMIYGLPWMFLVLAPLVPVYHWLQDLYRLTSRELKRLSSVTLSPVYNHFNETLLGLPTIRSLRAVPRSVDSTGPCVPYDVCRMCVAQSV
jgi:ATP-binding cassette subfamily C (CFTR/MRP) protein 10